MEEELKKLCVKLSEMEKEYEERVKKLIVEEASAFLDPEIYDFDDLEEEFNTAMTSYSGIMPLYFCQGYKIDYVVDGKYALFKSGAVAK